MEMAWRFPEHAHLLSDLAVNLIFVDEHIDDGSCNIVTDDSGKSFLNFWIYRHDFSIDTTLI